MWPQSCLKVVSDVRVANVFSKFVSKRPVGTGESGGDEEPSRTEPIEGSGGAADALSRKNTFFGHTEKV